MHLFSCDPEVETIAVELHARGMSSAAALQRAQQQVKASREHVGMIAKVLPMMEYGPLGVAL